MRWGLLEKRDPNAFFESAWYSEHYPDVRAGTAVPLLHYLRNGAAELRNPHPKFDAAWYVEQHPEAAENPLLYHVEIGAPRKYLTIRPIDIDDYLPAKPHTHPYPNRLRVDVVIPVYRGLDETRACIESVIANTGEPLGRIIVVDDCSPEPALVDWLQTIAASGRIHLLRNKRNLGFVRSVNAGMVEAGKNDVVLLNSDTEVPANWLPRLAGQAYASRKIASVSPFSNNATICSYPALAGGPLAFGRSVSDIDATCQSVNAGRWADVPTTVGFCMYIRRAALDRVGLFDAERFKMGYGEENDFCLRASALGWRHRLACDTFVYHKGAVSFLDRTTKLSRRAAKLIEERFPDYHRNVANHISLAEADPFRFTITAALLRSAGLPVILMVMHDLGGGIQRHMDIVTERCAGRANVVYLLATDRGAEISIPALPGHPRVALPADRVDDLLRLLRSLSISRVHIHHLLGMDFDIRGLIHRLCVPFDVTMHDYQPLCPHINLTPWRHSPYCGEPEVGACNTCIVRRYAYANADIITWRMGFAWLFRDAERVLCPSQDVIDRLRRHGFADRAVLAPHEPVAAAPWPMLNRPPGKAERLRVAVLGTLVDHKGARSVATVAERAGAKGPEIHLIGDTDGPFPPPARKRMRITGRYDDADLAKLIETVDPHIIWFPMIWPETYSYTLSAAIESGRAIAAARIGSFPERLAGRPLTWLTPIDTSPDAWIALFETIGQALQDGPPTTAPHRSPVEDFYAERYLEPLFRRPPARKSSRPRILLVPERFNNDAPTPCGFIRVIQPLSHPAISSDFDVAIADHETALEQAADIIVTQRFALPDIAAADRLVAHAGAVGASLVYDLDDDLLNIPKNHPDAAVLRPLAKTAQHLLERADVVWVSTPSLAARVAPIRPDIVVIENRLDERIWRYTQPSPPAFDTPVRIFVMGTTTHDQDFELILPALERIRADFGERVTVDILGMTNRLDLPLGINRVTQTLQALGTYPNFVEWMTTCQPPWHIGLAPLLESPFNDCKSPIKAMDYAAIGLATLASDVPVYRGSLADGIAGRLVSNTPDAWYAALDDLIRDVETRTTLMASARDNFAALASLASQATVRRDALHRAYRIRQPVTVSAA
jgi:GT2 family glycosyltransferase/glycosyltransferase involved in cell wall biosynthesis